MEIDSAPVEIDTLQRVVERMKLEEFALEKEKDDASKERLVRLRERLRASESELAELQERWRLEKASLNRVGELRARTSKTRRRSATWPCATARYQEASQNRIRDDPRDRTRSWRSPSRRNSIRITRAW